MVEVSLDSIGPFTLDTRTEFNLHWLRSHLNLVWGDTNWMRNEPIHLWRWIGTEFIVYSSKNNKITCSYAPTNSNIVETTIHAVFKIWTMMDYHARTLMTRCCWKETTYKWHRVVCRNLHYTLSTIIDKVNGWSSVCVSIHLECSIKLVWKSLLELQWVWHADSNSVIIRF